MSGLPVMPNVGSRNRSGTQRCRPPSDAHIDCGKTANLRSRAARSSAESDAQPAPPLDAPLPECPPAHLPVYVYVYVVLWITYTYACACTSVLSHKLC